MSGIIIPSAAELAGWRDVVGMSAGMWARRDLKVGAGWWWAFSGSEHPSYNVVCAHHPDGREKLLEGLATLTEARTPGLCMLAGPGLSLARDLADEGLVCVNAIPLIAFDLPEGEPDPKARVLRGSEREEAWAVVADAFEIGNEVAAVAVPVDENPDMDERLYGLFEDGEIACVVGIAGSGLCVGGWSMATAKSKRGRGYGRRMVASALVSERARGATTLLGLASGSGLPLYMNIGATVVEHWQVWSRPRWVLGR